MSKKNFPVLGQNVKIGRHPLSVSVVSLDFDWGFFGLEKTLYPETKFCDLTLTLYRAILQYFRRSNPY